MAVTTAIDFATGLTTGAGNFARDVVQRKVSRRDCTNV